jgi:diguanylate cyclase (GGDEF)-like protein
MRTSAGATRPAVVLIASKQEWTSRSLESILAPRGYIVLKAYTRRQTLEQARRDEPDAIILDAHLPDGDGYELCRQLRAELLITPSTPIILTVPHPPTRRDRLAALQAGAWDCLGEPPDAEELLAILDVFVPAKLDADQARTEGLVDETTGLYNVRGLTRRARELASSASRRHGPLACVMLAPDPSPEEVEGVPEDAHAAVLRRIAGKLRSTARVSDAIGRLGPSAFAVVAVDTDGAQARQLAERLASAILADPAPADPLPAFRLRGGCHGVPDFHAASIDTVELMLCATAALQKARSDPAGTWLRGFDEVDDVRSS